MHVVLQGEAQTKVVLPGGNRPTPNCQSPNAIATADNGDTLKKIAQDTGVQVSKLAKLNPQINSNDLRLNKGDQICVPPRAINGCQ